MKIVYPILLALLCCINFSVANDFIYRGSFLWNDIRAVVQREDYLYGAFSNGVAMIELGSPSIKKAITAKLEVDGQPYRLRVFDVLLVVEKENGMIDLIDISNPYLMEKKGSLPAPAGLHDLEVIGNYIYFALGYDGLARYDISDMANIIFDDSSLAGINTTALEVYGQYLCVLDNYNGVLIYEPTSQEIGNPVSELLLPTKPISLTVANDTVYAGIKPSGFMVGYLGDLNDPAYLESRNSFIRADFIAAVANGLVLYNSFNGFELIYNTPEPNTDYLFPINSIKGYGIVYQKDMSDFIVVPDNIKGIVAYRIDNPESIDLDRPEYEYKYPGPIRQLEFVNGYLHVIGPGNPYEVYYVSLPGTINLASAIINPFYQPEGVCLKGDTIFVADKYFNTFFNGVVDNLGGIYINPRLFSVSDDVRRPFLVSDYFTNGDLLYFHNETNFNGSFVSAEAAVPNFIRWHFEDGITAAWPTISHLFQVSTTNRLHVYSIDRFYDIEEEAVFDLSGQINSIFRLDSLLYLGGSDLIILNVNDIYNISIVSTIFEPDQIREMNLTENELICAAENGVFIYALTDGLPQLLFWETEPAVTVARHEEIIALSDAHSVKLYALPQTFSDDNHNILPVEEIPELTGYPNPFNVSVNLKLSRFKLKNGDIQIDIFDILGRRVNSLWADDNKYYESIIWDGTDSEGRTVASGIYLIKAYNLSEQASFKAVLIK